MPVRIEGLVEDEDFRAILAVAERDERHLAAARSLRTQRCDDACDADRRRRGPDRPGRNRDERSHLHRTGGVGVTGEIKTEARLLVRETLIVAPWPSLDQRWTFGGNVARLGAEERCLRRRAGRLLRVIERDACRR